MASEGRYDEPMRLNVGIAIAMLAACGLARAAATGGAITLSTTARAGLKPVEVSESFAYPILTHAQARVTGLVPGRSYAARAYATEGRGLEVGDRSWTFTPDGPEALLAHQIPAHGAYAAGTWTYVFMVDGVKVAERSVQAIRELPPEPPSTAPPGVPPPKAAAADVTLSISRNLKAREPLLTLGLSGPGVFFLVEARGLTPGHIHQIQGVVRDGKGNIVGLPSLGLTPQKPDTSIWLPLVPSVEHAPGRWSFLMQVDRRDLAQIELDARPGAHQTRVVDPTARFSWYVLTAALFAMLLFIAYRLWNLAGTPAPARAAPPPATPSLTLQLLDPTLLALVAANLLPLAFVATGRADAGELLAIYWIENLIVAGYAILRMASARGDPADTLLARAFFILFFMVHFGVFCGVHAFALYRLALSESGLLPLDPHSVLDYRLHDAFPQPAPWQGIPDAFAVLIAALAVSHGLSYVRNFLLRGEIFHASAADAMFRPYRRMIPMHLATLACGFLAVAQQSAGAVLVLLVLIKTVVDAALHIESHATASQPLPRV
jgi:hypothetical protein